MTWSICTWTKDGLAELATAHDRADAERTRDDFDGRPWVPGKPFITRSRTAALEGGSSCAAS